MSDIEKILIPPSKLDEMLGLNETREVEEVVEKSDLDQLDKINLELVTEEQLEELGINLDDLNEVTLDLEDLE